MKQPLRNLIHGGAVVLFYTLLYTAFFAPVLFSGRLLAPHDGTNFFVPAFHSPRALWNPLLLSGFPAMGNPQNMLWYPVALVFSWIPDSWNAFVLSAYVLASCFTYGYVYLLTGSRLAGAASGLIYGMSGFFISHLRHADIIHSSAWMPLLIWALEKLRDRVSAGWLLVAALGAGNCMLGGHPQFFVYATGLAVCYVLVAGWQASCGTLRYYAAAFVGIMLGAGSAGIAILPAVELSALSTRAQLPLELLLGYSVNLRELPRLFFPYLYGGFWNPLNGALTPFFGRFTTLAESTGYVGCLPLLLAAVGLRFENHKRLARFWLSVAVIALLLALGGEFPLARLSYYVPGYNKFRVPSRHLVEFTLAVSVLAGLGIRAFPRFSAVARLQLLRRSTVTLLVLVLTALLASFIRYASGGLTKDLAGAGLSRVSWIPWRNPAIGIPLVLLTVSFVVVWNWARFQTTLSTAALMGALLLEMSSFGWFYEWHYWKVTPNDFRLPNTLAKYRASLANTGQRMISLEADAPPDVPRPAENIPSNRFILWGIPNVLGYSSLTLSRYHELIGFSQPGFSLYKAWDGPTRSFDILSTRYVFVPKRVLAGKPDLLGDTGGPTLSQSSRLARLEDLDQTVVFENKRAMPRVWLVRQVIQMQRRQILRAIQESRLPSGFTFNPAEVALVEEPVALSLENPDGNATARLALLSDTRIEIHTDSGTEAFLVLSDLYYPGWEASINGKPIHIFQTDYVLRGVRVPPGHSVVRFQFRPASFYAGVTASACSVAMLLGILVFSWTRRFRGRNRLPDFRQPQSGCADLTAEFRRIW